jgi:predicted nucleic acid-binding protein
MIVDASVLLHAFLPDEIQSNALAVVRDHVSGRLHLKAPALLPYELANAVWQAERRGRLTRSQADRVMQAFNDLDIEIISQAWGGMLLLARQYERSAYDAAYLQLAQELGEKLITCDQRLYHAVHEHLDWVLWLEDYPAGQELA